LRSLASSRRLPTYTVIAAIAVGVIVLGFRHHLFSSDTFIFLLVFIPAVILHEISHGVVALWCGDDTAKAAGRLTLNPLKHIDPIGSVVLPILLAISGAPVLGWAKPVPISINRLRHPRNQSVLVALAGPATNMILAAIAGLCLHFLVQVSIPPVYVCGSYMCYEPISQWALLEQIAFYFGLVNVSLAVFNLIPIPPLDGSALIERLLPASALPGYYRMRMGFIVVVLLVVVFDNSLLSHLLGNVENWYLNLAL